MPDAFQLLEIECRIVNLHTRFPFRYGIACLEAVPHLFLQATVEVDGKRHVGIAADSLAPKWFTKVPERPFRDEIEEMIAVIRRAGERALDLPTPDFFTFWRALAAGGRAEDLPPLLTQFGSSLVERAVLEALCRAWEQPVFELLRGERLGIDLGALRPELKGLTPGELLPPGPPPQTVVARHTVGLGDPLTPAEIEDPVEDGLPQCLEDCIAAYGLTHFKLKLCGEVDRDVDRMRTIARLIGGGGDFAFTLDGNEQYREVAAFRAMWEQLAATADLSGLLFVEQPFHRDVALSEETGRELMAWAGRPPLIIDESDGELDSAAQALAAGYIGTSHKNCKGVVKSVVNACAFARRDPPGIMSGEDLVNVGPVALLQDLAVAASLGVTHVERNGHHYFRGLGAFPATVQAQVMSAHPDLYDKDRIEVPSLTIRKSRIALGSVMRAPFGCGFDLSMDGFTPMADWRYEDLEGGG